MRINVKHAGRVLPVEIDDFGSAITFKNTVSQATGVPPERLKIMVKGGVLKDDANLPSLGLKENQTIMVIGTAQVLPQPKDLVSTPAETSSEKESDDPELHSGLVNLGQTCYLNSSLQVLRAINPLRDALERSSRNTSLGNTAEGRLTRSMHSLFSMMSGTDTAIPPFGVLNSLRSLVPQFSERDLRGVYAQQDADEAWTALVAALRLALPTGDGETSSIDHMMEIELEERMTCLDAPQETPSVHRQKVLKLECNIAITTNFLLSGIMDSFDQNVEKTSLTLNRMALYNKTTRISRLPQYLPIHMVRFYWRREIQKKAKIMRKVKFPLILDLAELMTPELRDKLQPLANTVKDVCKSREDRAKSLDGRSSSVKPDAHESELRNAERHHLLDLATQNGVPVEGDSIQTGVYELCAMITHKGPSADSGHYIGWTKEDSASPYSNITQWRKFDDDKVSFVSSDKILSMDGGGEDSVAYILLYRSVQL